MLSKLNLAQPTKQQLQWQDLETGMFCHFGINTFTGKEWGDGTEPASLFNPTAFDAKQWTSTAKRAGFRYIILTAKHHDGFCLWPTRTTEYSVKNSPWKDGAGDIVREVADACREEGLLFGLYLSPWDRHEPCYGNQEAYNDFYAEQLTELLTEYGPLVELWFDGAGSEGREYDWRRIVSLVEKYQPDAMRFNMGIPTIRWVGNEDGVAPYPCWNAADTARASMFTQETMNWLPETPRWLPAECDVPIRKEKWFWHPDTERDIHSLDELLTIYYRSVGHGCNLLMNLAPDNRGLIPDKDADAAIRLNEELGRRFSNLLGSTQGVGEERTVHWGRPEAVDHVVLMENIAQGERIRSYLLEALQEDGSWSVLVTGSAIGHKKIDLFDAVKTNEIRLRVLQADAEPEIRLMSVYGAVEKHL